MTRDWKAKSVTYQPTDKLTWVGARDTCVSKKCTFRIVLTGTKHISEWIDFSNSKFSRDLAAIVVVASNGVENLQMDPVSALGNLPHIFGTWSTSSLSMKGPKGLNVGKIMTKKELYKGNLFAKKTILGRGPFSATVGSQVIFAFDEREAAVTITRSVPGNETAFLVPSTQCHIFSQEQKVSITAAPEELGVDFVVHTPAPVFQLCYEDEDLHMERRLSVELIDNGGMSMVEILIDKTRNTITEVQSVLTKVSNKGTPYYKTLELESTQIVNVGKMIAALKTRKPNCCTKCGNRTKGHLGPTGKFCNMNKV